MATGTAAHAPLHPLRTLLLAGAMPLFLGALLSDAAYCVSYEVQWKNFASWFLVGALFFSGFALLWALIALVRVRPHARRRVISFFLLLAAWPLGLIDAFVHAGDAWASMPAGVILSAIVTVLATAAAWLALAGPHGSAVA